MSKLVPLPSSLPAVLKDYLPQPTKTNLPFVTLTYATSLDSRISAAPGTQTIISHPETKTMTHYLRYHHDAILVGVGTVLADDPGLNCRWTPAENDPIHLIQPIVVDPEFKWDPRGSRLVRTAAEGQGLGPFVVVRSDALKTQRNAGGAGSVNTADPSLLDPETASKIQTLESVGGRVIVIPVSSHGTSSRKIAWSDILGQLYLETTSNGRPVRSVMVEGGATVINSLLDETSARVESHGPPPLVSSVVVTVGPVFLGSRGVAVSPVTSQPRLNHVRWWTGARDAIVCGRLL